MRGLFATDDRRRRGDDVADRHHHEPPHDHQAAAPHGRSTASRSTAPCPGAQGGEVIVVSIRRRGTTAWRSTQVLAGANDGSFTATFSGVTASSEFVAQWAGDSGRQGAGSPVLRVLVK